MTSRSVMVLAVVGWTCSAFAETSPSVVTQGVRLAQMRAEVARAKMKVGYPGKFYEPTPAELAWKLPDLALVPCALAATDDYYDAGEESVGYLEVTAPAKPEMFVGESIAEMRNERREDFEQTTELTSVASNVWRSVVPLAFRYARFKGPISSVRLLEQVDPMLKNRGGFTCADARLEKMWRTGVRTVRLCTRHFMVDGVKRDRLPWAGDFMISLLSQAYTFADAATLRRTMEVLDSAGPDAGEVNGFIDYSLWLVIAHDAYQLHFGDLGFLRAHYGSLARRLDGFTALAGADGLLDRRDGHAIFVDWTDAAGRGAKPTVNMIYYGALQAGARLADRLGHEEDAARWRARAETLRTAVRRSYLDIRTGLFGDTRYPNVYAVLFGIADTKERGAIADALMQTKMPAVGTPYCATMEAMALVRCGRADAALAGVRRVWGAMLDRGATTFWEGWDETKTGDAVYSFYGRPFANSLCHAWSSSPAFFFARCLGGIRPTSDGWKTYEIKPCKEAYGMSFEVPTPRGVLSVSVGADGRVTESFK